MKEIGKTIIKMDKVFLIKLFSDVTEFTKGTFMMGSITYTGNFSNGVFDGEGNSSNFFLLEITLFLLGQLSSTLDGNLNFYKGFWKQGIREGYGILIILWTWDNIFLYSQKGVETNSKYTYEGYW